MDKKRVILKIVFVVMILAAVGCLGGIGYTVYKYESSKQEYSELNEYVLVEKQETKTVTDVQEQTPVEEPEEEKEPQYTIEVDFDMDYEALKAINEDFVGWLYYEGADISYPVVLDKGTNYYENHSFEKKSNSSGAIFMDYVCKTNLTSFNTIIYGHNMRNGTMFAFLNDLLEDVSVIDSYPYFYIFTKDKILMYKIVSGYHTTKNNKTYDISLDMTLEDMKAYVEYMDEVSEFRDEEFFGKDVCEEMKLCTLSTCNGHNTENRSVIHGELVATKER